MSRAHYRTTLYSAPCRSSRPRALMNRNSNPNVPRIIFTETRETRSGTCRRGIRPYGRSWQRPGGTPDHWPAGAGELECPGGIPGWAKYRAAARSRVHPCENLKVVSFAANSRATMAIWAAGVGARLGHPSPGRPESHSRLSSPFPEFLPLASSRSGPGWLANGCGQPPRYGPAPGSRAAPRHDRHGPNPRPPAQIRSNVPRGATRSSTAGYFILPRIKVT
jgi:hypothetical protein